jgi:hypothetical protein
MLLSGRYNQSAGAPSPRFPVRLGGVNKHNAAFLIESRTSNHGWCRAGGNSGSCRCFSGKGRIPQLLTHTVVYPTLRKNREGWGTRSSRRYRPAHPRPCRSASTLVRNPG